MCPPMLAYAEKTDTLIVGRENGRGQHSYGQAYAIDWRLVTKVLGRDLLGPMMLTAACGSLPFVVTPCRTRG